MPQVSLPRRPCRESGQPRAARRVTGPAPAAPPSALRPEAAGEARPDRRAGGERHRGAGAAATCSRAPTRPAVPGAAASRRPSGSAAQPSPGRRQAPAGGERRPRRAGGSGESPEGGARSGGNFAGRDGRRLRPLAGLPARSGASSARPPGRAASPWQSHIPAAGGGRRRSGEERSPACRRSRAAGSARLGGEELPRAPAPPRDGGCQRAGRASTASAPAHAVPKVRTRQTRGNEAGLRRRGEPRPPRATGAVPVPFPSRAARSPWSRQPPPSSPRVCQKVLGALPGDNYGEVS